MKPISQVVSVLALVVACAACGPDEPVDYANRFRYPSDQGVVTSVDFSKIQLDGGKSRPVSPDIQSFSTYTGKPAPLLGWKNRYVHLGLKDGRVVWIAGVGFVDETAVPPSVFYTNGKVRKIESRTVVFADGTVLRFATGVKLPAIGSRVTAKIDAIKHVVIQVTTLVGAPNSS